MRDEDVLTAKVRQMAALGIICKPLLLKYSTQKKGVKIGYSKTWSPLRVLVKTQKKDMKLIAREIVNQCVTDASKLSTLSSV